MLRYNYLSHFADAAMWVWGMQRLTVMIFLYKYLLSNCLYFDGCAYSELE